MISHQDMTMDAPPAPLTGFRERFEKNQPVQVVKKIASARLPQSKCQEPYEHQPTGPVCSIHAIDWRIHSVHWSTIQEKNLRHPASLCPAASSKNQPPRLDCPPARKPRKENEGGFSIAGFCDSFVIF